MNYLKFKIPTLTIFAFALFMGENVQSQPIHAEIFETSEAGNQLTPIQTVRLNKRNLYAYISLHPATKFQKITGFGGSFTQASASLLNQLSIDNRKKILEAYFSEQGANYSLTRTHINSCDFSTHNYAYNTTPGDTLLKQFDISEDEKGIIPMIQEAQRISKDGFKIIASPWTAPPWMKTNNSWKGGKLLPQYNKTWARYFEKYIKAYRQKGIDIWGITVENEPLGNDNNWESMLFSPEEMSEFVGNYLGPHLKETGLKEVVILGYDQNRGDELKKWADAMYKNPLAAKYFGGTAVHWYASTYHVFEESLNYTHQLAPTKHLINTEACVDAEVPKWKEDKWYWQKEATDWGWDWATEKDKYLHPKYAPVFR
ncbi:MAG: glycoside hydrolase family 30 protein, partial [Chitinophagaceae bacterium]